MNSNNNSNTPVFPGVIVSSSSPRPATPMEDSGDGGRLPLLSPRRNVLLSGRAASSVIVNQANASGSKMEAVCQDPCGGLSPAQSSCNRTLMAGMASRGRYSQTFLRAPGHSGLSISPALSDVSSIRLTPKSPGGTRHAYYAHDAFRTPEGSRKSSLSRGRPGHEVDDSVIYPLHPPIQSYSPYLNSPMLTASPQAFLSRKRALSISPLSELLDINSIRMSPNSLALTSGSAPGRPGSISHLIGRLSPNYVVPALPPPNLLPPAQIQTQQQRVSLEQAMRTDLNPVIITSEATLQREHAVLPWASSQPCCPEGQMTWNSLHTSSSNMVLTSGEPEVLEDTMPMDTQLCTSSALVCQWRECGLTFEEQDDMVRHIEKVHVEPKQSQEQYVCYWDKCTRSGKPFNARYKLLIHMRTHSGEKPNKCNFPGCDKAFSRMENLRIHLRSHTGERPYPCQFAGCSKTFSNSSDRSKHQRTHYEQKPYACTHPGCAKKYTDPSSLRKHVRTHTLPRKKPRNDTEPEQLQTILTVQPIHKAVKATAKKPALVFSCESPIDLEEVKPSGTVLHKPPAHNTEPLALYQSQQPMQEYIGYVGGQCEHMQHAPTPLLLPGGPASPLSLAAYDYSPPPFVHSQLHNAHFGSQYTSTPDHPPPPYTAQ